MKYLLVLLLFSVNTYAETLTVAVESFKEVRSVKANVTIENGLVTQSNCKDLSEANGNRNNYYLELINNSYFCIPKITKIASVENIEIPIGFDLTIDNIRKAIHLIGKEYEESNGMSASIDSNQSSPVCKIGENNSVDLSTCICESVLFNFDVESKKCLLSSSILSYYANTCSKVKLEMESVLDIVGKNLAPSSSSFSFGSCGVESHLYRVMPNILNYKVIYFTYFKQSIKSKLEDQGVDFENVYLAVKRSEIANYKKWLSSYTSEDFAREKINRATFLSDAIQNRLIKEQGE